MLDKLIEQIKSQTSFKKVCIFLLAFVATVNVIGGNHEIFYGSIGDGACIEETAQESPAMSALEADWQQVPEIPSDETLAAKKAPKLAELSSGAEESDQDSKDNSKAESKSKDAEDYENEIDFLENTTVSGVATASGDNEQVNEEPSGFIYSDKIPMSRELQEYTYKKCEERGLEYELILAIIWRESRFNVDAVNVNSNGTRDNGIMQINDVNRKWLQDNYGITDLMDPYQNIDAGTAMLGRLTSKYGTHNAMLAYQYGEGGMSRKLRQGITTSTATEKAYQQREYYRKIF